MGESEAQLVIKSRLTCIAETEGALSATQQLLREGIARIDSGEDAGQVLATLEGLLKFKKIVKSISVATRDYHDAIKTLGKVCILQGLDAATTSRRLKPSNTCGT
jgi:hypothetical protein